MSNPDRIVVPDVRHSRLGPSSSERWLNCAGSNNLIDKVDPALRTSEYAEEGTAAHALAALCLVTATDAWIHSGKIIEVNGHEYTVNEEMVEGVQVYLDAVRALMKEYPNGILYVERELSSILDDDAFGQGDVVYEVPGIAIFILDLKFGIGVCVEPTKPQVKIYGYLAYEGRSSVMRTDEGEPQKIIVGIAQPRMPHPDGPVRWKSYDVAEVEEWFASTILPGMAATREPGALLCVGEWCQFCPVKRANKCPAIYQEVMEIKPEIEPKTLTGEELGHFIAKLDVLVKVLERAETEAFQRMVAGESVYGRKLVHKKANRVFRPTVDEEVVDPETGEVKNVVIKLDDAINLVFGLDAYHPAELKSPAQLEELPMGAEFVARWAYKPDAGLTIAGMNDKRGAVRPLMERMDEAPAAKAGDIVI